MKRKLKRIILVNRDFQLKYAKIVIFLGFISTVFTSAVLLIPLFQFQILRIAEFLPLPILTAIGVACAGNILLMGLLGIHLTHRIAGPMYSLARSFREVERGRWRHRVRLRKHDELWYVVRNFNAMMDAISRQGEYDYTALCTIEEKLEDLKGGVEISGLVDELKSAYKARLWYETDGFK